VLPDLKFIFRKKKKLKKLIFFYSRYSTLCSTSKKTKIVLVAF